MSKSAGSKRPIRIAFTPGEPAGIGPDLAVRLAQQTRDRDILAVACPRLLAERAEMLGLPLQLQLVTTPEAVLQRASGQLSVWPIETIAATRAGHLDPANADYVLETLQVATGLCLQGQCSALLTGPVHKGHLRRAGHDFKGHTEYLATLCGSPPPLMMLVGERLRVALLTTHMPLRSVPEAITAPALERALTLLNSALQEQFKIAHPRLVVCGLNPHAGEGGSMGREEQEIIAPCLQQLQSRGLNIVGPLPADTAFLPQQLAEADAVLAMYHDQGLPVLKYSSFGCAVNITLGLPILRTSVDHGTALDRAGSGDCDDGSLIRALHWAATLADGVRSA